MNIIVADGYKRCSLALIRPEISLRERSRQFAWAVFFVGHSCDQLYLDWDIRSTKPLRNTLEDSYR